MSKIKPSTSDHATSQAKSHQRQLCPKYVDNDKESPSQAESALIMILPSLPSVNHAPSQAESALSEQVKERASEGKEVNREIN